MKLLKAALAVGCLLCSPAVLAEHNTNHDDSWPPLRYMGDNTGVAVFTHDVSKLCGEAPRGYVIEACETPIKDPRTNQEAPLLVLPNPCSVDYATEAYAKLVCHELGHANGWPANHPL